MAGRQAQRQLFRRGDYSEGKGESLKHRAVGGADFLDAELVVAGLEELALAEDSESSGGTLDL